MKLYFARRTRSTRPRWLLEELGVPYELVTVKLQAGEHKSEAHLKLHPLGLVPVLEDDGTVLFESAAILLHLGDRFFDRGFAPALGTVERGQYYKWILFAAATLEPSVVAYGAAALGDEASRNPAAAEVAKRSVHQAFDVIAAALGDAPFILGEKMSAADVLLGSLLVWCRAMKLTTEHPVLEAYAGRLAAREAYKRAQV